MSISTSSSSLPSPPASSAERSSAGLEAVERSVPGIEAVERCSSPSAWGCPKQIGPLGEFSQWNVVVVIVRYQVGDVVLDLSNCQYYMVFSRHPQKTTLDQHTSVELRGLSYPVRHEGLPRQSGTQTNHKPFHVLGLPRFHNHGYGVRAGFLSTIMGPPFILLRSRPFCDSS